MKKILDTKYPIITTYTHHAHLLSILGTSSMTKFWIFSNYIQIYINRELNVNSWADFYFPMPYETRPFELCKWIEVQKNSEEFIDKNQGDIIKYIIDLIDNNYYVHLMINYRYLSKSRYNKKNVDARHDILVYGYDSEIKTLYCADFMFETSKYSFCNCTYDEFYEAYNNDFVKKQASYLNHNIYSYKLKKGCDYEFHINNIVYWIKQYINSETPEYWKGYNYSNMNNIAWGISCYDILIQNLKSIGITYIDVRFYCLLKDHKKIMIERLRFIENNTQLLKEYVEFFEEIYSEFVLIVNLVIKYNMTNNLKIIDKIVAKLTEIKNNEYETLVRLIDGLEVKS